MAVTTIATANKLATGINVFTLPRERHAELIGILTAINDEILKHRFPMNVSANFHRAIDAPVVLITGYPDKNIPARAEAAGVKHVMRKPLLDDSLIKRIRGAIEDRRSAAPRT